MNTDKMHPERIRVLHMLPMCWQSGGAEAMAVHLMCALDKSRYEVAALSLYQPLVSTPEKDLAASGIPLWTANKSVGFDPHMFGRIDRILREFQPHVVHTHLRVLHYAGPALWWRRIPAIVHTMHRVAELDTEAGARWVNWLAFHWRVVVVSIAHEVSTSLERVYGVRHAPLIPNGIPLEQFAHAQASRAAWRQREGFQPHDFLFVCVARLHTVKNQPLLIESFARGPAADSRAHLLLAGFGDLRAELERDVQQRGLTSKIHFLGERSDIRDLLGASDVFVLGSNSEGNPLSVMEAMAAGLPVICTAVGGVPDLVDSGGEGILVPPADPVAMSRAMLSMLEDPQARRSLGVNAAQRAKNQFGLDPMVQAYSALYQQLLQLTPQGKSSPVDECVAR